MKEGIESTGVPTMAELRKVHGLPSDDRLKKGPVVVIECLQEIPCNPCEKACAFGAIKVGEIITNLPEVDEAKCKGCGLCIASCPGLAIFVVDYDFSEDEALIMFPYEFLPKPKMGDVVDATDRSGKAVTRARVVNIVEGKNSDHTAVISIAVPKEFIHDVRGIRRSTRSCQ